MNAQNIKFTIALLICLLIIPVSSFADCWGDLNVDRHSMHGTDYGDGVDGPYIDNANGTVSDIGRGLMWQQIDDGIKRNRDEACSYCSGLELGGYSDWYIPHVAELESIIDLDYSAKINTNFFYNTKLSGYWARGFNASGDRSQTWITDFETGHSDWRWSYDSVTHYVRCVRLEPSTLSDTLTIIVDTSETIGSSPLDISFRAIVVSGNLSAEYDSYSGGGFSYLWDFGDGYTSTSASPVHTYYYTNATKGNYTASLTVKDQSGHSKTQSTTITVTEPTTYSLDYTVSPSSAGYITVSPDKTSYTQGETVTLTATPNSGYEFSNWSGDVSGTSSSITITMNSNKSITAIFQANTHTLNATATTGGTVSKSPSKTEYNHNDKVLLTAIPDDFLL